MTTTYDRLGPRVSELADYTRALRAGEVAVEPGALPPHYPTCFGCGPDAPGGLHLKCRRDGQDVVATYTFRAEHSGAPGIAHGGSVATLVDDVCGFLLFVLRQPGVTRHLAVDYLAPVLIGVPYDVRARIERHEGRKVFVSCVGSDPEGRTAFRGEGLFIVVDVSHFDRASRADPDEQPPVTP